MTSICQYCTRPSAGNSETCRGCGAPLPDYVPVDPDKVQLLQIARLKHGDSFVWDVAIQVGIQDTDTARAHASEIPFLSGIPHRKDDLIGLLAAVFRDKLGLSDEQALSLFHQLMAKSGWEYIPRS